MAKNAKEVPFFEDGKIYASVAVNFTAEGKKILIPSEGFVLFPMKIEDVDIKAKGWDPDLIQFPLIGDIRYRCYMIPVRKELYLHLMDLEWAEAKASTRRRRCRIPAADGSTKVCRNRSCYGCPRAGEDHITSQETSLDALMEDTHFEVSTGDTTSTTAMSQIEEEEFITYLKQHKPVYKLVYEWLKEGYSTVEIAEKLDVTDRMIRIYRSKIVELYKEFNA